MIAVEPAIQPPIAIEPAVQPRPAVLPAVEPVPVTQMTAENEDYDYEASVASAGYVNMLFPDLLV